MLNNIDLTKQIEYNYWEVMEVLCTKVNNDLRMNLQKQKQKSF